MLLPLSYLYCLVTSIRRLLYRFSLLKQTRFPVPIIVVGNISVGGTGKTPLLIRLVELLQENGYRPGVVSRGYGGRASTENKLTPISVTGDSDPVQVGDEPVMIAQRCNCPVCVCPSRVKAVTALLNETDCNVIVSDDGLQHYALGRDVEIAVIDGERQLGNRLCLPAGPLRESENRLNSVDLIVFNGSNDSSELKVDKSREFRMRLVMQDMRQVRHPEMKRPLSFLNGRAVHAIAGIGNPQRFFAQLRDQVETLIEHPFNDHYAYEGRDIDFDDNLPVIMTEKDAVKCRALASNKHWYIPVDAVCDQNILTRVLDLIKHPRTANEV